MPGADTPDALSDQAPYNEVYSATGVREAYRGLVPLLAQQTPAGLRALQKKTSRATWGDYQVTPVARMLTAREMVHLQKGVAQRSQAIRLFLEDHYSGRKSYLAAGVIPEPVVKALFNRHGCTAFEGVIRPEDLSFWHAPDIIRGPDGKFYVCEDNVDYIGGLIDGYRCERSVLRHVPGVAAVADSPGLLDFYAALIADYRTRMPDGGEIVLLDYTQAICDTHEGLRLRRELKKFGVETVSVRDSQDDKRYHSSLDVTKDGVVLRARGQDAKPVGLVIAYMNPSGLDPHDRPTSNQKLVEYAQWELKQRHYRDPKLHARLARVLTPDHEEKISIRALRRFYAENAPAALKMNDEQGGIPGLMAAARRGKVQVVGLPGVQVAGDKEFSTYMQQITEFYVGPPILENIRAQSFRRHNAKGTPELDADLVRTVFSRESYEGWVIKGVNDSGGHSVWIGKKMSWEAFKALNSKVRARPHEYIAQRYIPISRVAPSAEVDMFVDVRLLSNVRPGGVDVALPPWARGSSAGDGLTNIGAKGVQMQVFYPKEGVEPPRFTPPTRQQPPRAAAADRKRLRLPEEATTV